MKQIYCTPYTEGVPVVVLFLFNPRLFDAALTLSFYRYSVRCSVRYIMYVLSALQFHVWDPKLTYLNIVEIFLEP